MKEFLKSLLASVLGTFLAGALCAFLLLVLIVAGLSSSGAGVPTVSVRPGTILLVGHEPDFSTAVSFLLGLPEPDNFPIRKASLTAIEAPWIDAGSGALEFSITPKLL